MKNPLVSVSVPEIISPARLGLPFRWLLASSWASNIGDGIVLAAGPLLIASETSSPFLVALAALLQRLPFMVLGLWAGAIADRVDRRSVVMAANLARAVVIAVLAGTIATGAVNIPNILTSMLLLGCAETFADTTSGTLVPSVVPREYLATSNHRMSIGFIAGNQLIGPPLGAFFFGIGHVVPFGVQGVTVAVAIILVSRINLCPVPEGAPGLALSSSAGTARIRTDIAEGARWLWQNNPVRMLAIIILVFNITWAGAWAVLVLWSREILGMDVVGFGLLTSFSALGGIAGSALFPVLARRVNYALLMRICLCCEVALHLIFFFTFHPWVAMAGMAFFGLYAFVWGTLGQTIRMRAVPLAFQGRVTSVYLMCMTGGLVVGQALGGVVAEHFGLRAPFLFAFIGAGVTLAIVWKNVTHIAEAEAEPEAERQAEPETERQAEPEGRPIAEPETERQAEPEGKPIVEPELA
ncbi:MAG: MFS transporter [Cellulomonadaceae bacterium]|nr:MFS transporter [Cellulomonadaceae bacterium]